MQQTTHLALVVAASVVWLGRAEAATIYVAPRDSSAATAAQAKANGTSVFAERTFQRALDLAGELLAKPGAEDMTILLAGGKYQGKAGAGTWAVAPINNPKAAFRIVGGYKADWSARDPFGDPTLLETVDGRGGPFLAFGRGTRLKAIVVSGLVMDASPSNKYDAETNSLLKGSSRTFPLLTFGMAAADHLLVSDNVFVNGPHGAFEPSIVALTPNCVVDIQNNFFINNVKTMMIGPNNPATRTPIKEVNLRNNTFVLNWPYNPDRDSSNVGAVELYHKNSAATLNIEGNLFAYNPGGAFQHDWPENRMPAINFRRNLFFTNAALFGNNEPGAGPIVGKFGLNPKHLVLNLGTIEDDFKYKLEGNVVMDPGLKVNYQLMVKPGKGDDVDLKGYAPRFDFSPAALPFPNNAAAKVYGVQTDRITQLR
jgi:hypothetical protein